MTAYTYRGPVQEPPRVWLPDPNQLWVALVRSLCPVCERSVSKFHEPGISSGCVSPEEG